MPAEALQPGDRGGVGAVGPARARPATSRAEQAASRRRSGNRRRRPVSRRRRSAVRAASSCAAGSTSTPGRSTGCRGAAGTSRAGADCASDRRGRPRSRGSRHGTARRRRWARTDTRQRFTRVRLLGPHLTRSRRAFPRRSAPRLLTGAPRGYATTSRRVAGSGRPVRTTAGGRPVGAPWPGARAGLPGRGTRGVVREEAQRGSWR